MPGKLADKVVRHERAVTVLCTFSGAVYRETHTGPAYLKVIIIEAACELGDGRSCLHPSCCCACCAQQPPASRPPAHMTVNLHAQCCLRARKEDPFDASVAESVFLPLRRAMAVGRHGRRRSYQGSRAQQSTAQQTRQLPECLAYAAPFSWGVDFSGEHPILERGLYTQLVFVILRAVLPYQSLESLFFIESDGSLGVRTNPDFADSACCFSVAAASQKAVTETNGPVKNKASDRASDLHDGASAANRAALRDHAVSKKLIGLRLKFQKDRWTVGLPSKQRDSRHSYTARLHELRARPAGPSSSADSSEHQSRHIEAWLAQKRQPFIAISRLLAFWQYGDPGREVGHENREVAQAVHWRCDCTPGKRARCLNWLHITWALQTDNSYQMVEHNQGNQPGRRRPGAFTAPSSKPDYRAPSKG